MNRHEPLSVQEGDELYELLLDAHAGLGAEESSDLNARLVLVLATRLGDLAAFREALATARKPLGEGDA